MNKSINTIRMLGIDAINKAKSGHPGIVLGAAPMAYTLFTNHLTINPEVDKWINRDRFILSAGHGSALYYSLLHLSGFKITIDGLKKFRSCGSITPGHPESDITTGVDATTGPLGQGLAMSVGQALAQTHLASKYNKPDFNLIDHYTYVICGDGDLQEGVAQEAISLAGHWKLNKLIVLFDSNDVQLDDDVKVAQSEDIKGKFIAANWNYLKVEDGNDITAINNAINQAKTSNDKPSLIEIKTIIGFGTTKQGTSSVHGAPIGNDTDNLKRNLNWEHPEFHVPNEVYEDFNENVKQRGIEQYNKWVELFKQYEVKYPTEAKQLNLAIHGNFRIKKEDFTDLLTNINNINAEATRISSGKIVDRISQLQPNWIGGSADLSGSTKAKGAEGTYQATNRLGRNIAYGVREFAMSAINNGIYLHGGLLPFTSGFFVFADYMKAAMRLSSLMQLPIIYILSHDSIAVGEDGPTHQPVEQIAMLRSQPNLKVYRPCDFKETLGSYIQALNEKHTPSVILISRQDLPQLSTTSIENVEKGAYIINQQDNAKLCLIATGSEVSLALKVQEKLNEKKINSKVVSMVCQENFDSQTKQYQQQVLCDHNLKKVSIEVATTFGWTKYTGNDGLNIGLDSFGMSGKYEDVYNYFGFNEEVIANKIFNFLTVKK